ncbi:uncharacterized protein G2W53_033685 [Senna tora]|uniref:Uncharacterized protein n=1 Tax=Senna tora TaxID=362788 RepID=A0A834SZ25_9FABA|nr:uncharacterized protein G2W53_033685 [Senna tora]
MLRRDPRSSHAKTTPIGASKPLRFASTTRTDMFHSLAQRVICLVSEIRPRFVIRNMLRHDPRSSHAKTTPIGASKPLWFANTTRTDVFVSLAQQVFCLVIREGFLEPIVIYHPEYVETRSTLLPCQGDSNWSIKITPVAKIRPRIVIQNMLRHDPRSSHAKTTPIGASKPLRFANTTQNNVFDSLAQQVFCLVIREGFRDPTAICHPYYVGTRSTLFPSQDDSNWTIKTAPVSEIRPRFVVRNMLRNDPRSSHAKTTPIGASKPLRFANTTRNNVFDSLALQVFCLVIREGFLDRTAICRLEYVDT